MDIKNVFYIKYFLDPTISLKPKEPLKLKLDHMLHKDYENWRQDKINYNVLKS